MGRILCVQCSICNFAALIGFFLVDSLGFFYAENLPSANRMGLVLDPIYLVMFAFMTNTWSFWNYFTLYFVFYNFDCINDFPKQLLGQLFSKWSPQDNFSESTGSKLHSKLYYRLFSLVFSYKRVAYKPHDTLYCIRFRNSSIFNYATQWRGLQNRKNVPLTKSFCFEKYIFHRNDYVRVQWIYYF
jgi:hypothetical protein